MESRMSVKVTLLCFWLYLFSTIVLTTGSPTPETPKMPPMAAKAGGRIKPEFMQPDGQAELIEIPMVPLEDLDEDDFDYQEEKSDEKSCEEGMYWHIRGSQCVPERCPNGRDRETGICRELDDGGYYFQPFSGGGGGIRRSGGARGSWIRAANRGAMRARFAHGRGRGRGRG